MTRLFTQKETRRMINSVDVRLIDIDLYQFTTNKIYISTDIVQKSKYLMKEIISYLIKYINSLEKKRRRREYPNKHRTLFNLSMSSFLIFK
jgi:hypothetical protein